MKSAWECMERIEAETSITLLETEQSDIAGVISERDAEYKLAVIDALTASAIAMGMYAPMFEALLAAIDAIGKGE